MSNYKIVTKGVAFNILDPDQEELLEYALKRKNFSAYIKRLIYRDLSGGYASPIIQRKELVPETELDMENMGNII